MFLFGWATAKALEGYTISAEKGELKLPIMEGGVFRSAQTPHVSWLQTRLIWGCETI